MTMEEAAQGRRYSTTLMSKKMAEPPRLDRRSLGMMSLKNKFSQKEPKQLKINLGDTLFQNQKSLLPSLTSVGMRNI